MGKADAESMFASARLVSLGILHGAHPLVRTIALRPCLAHSVHRPPIPLAVKKANVFLSDA